jgi:molecular chaperone DnaK (HSP70)
MSVIGIDFGNEFCYIAVARSGGIETILNEFSSRATPTCVSMGERSRCMGTQAKNQMSSNVKNTVTNVKHLLGRKYRDKFVQQMSPHLPYTVVENPDGKIGIKVRYLNEEETFTPEQITSMVFAKLRDIAEAALKIKVNDCVISVPSYFTDCQRRSVLDSAYVAGLNVLRLLNETTAVALAYGIYKQDLPAPEEAPRNVVFVDMGQSSLQVSACAFHKGKLKMLSCAYDNTVGGFSFDQGMANEFIEEFKKKYKIDVNTKIKAKLRLLSEVEKLKKQMSANTMPMPLNIECFMDDKDVSSRMSR